MPQSLAKIYLHLVFCTKNRAPWLSDAVRDPLHRFMAAVLIKHGCQPVSINSVEDHIHILFIMSRTASVSRVVEEVKTSSSKWLKSQPGGDAAFAWQSGYGVFSVSASNVPAVRNYIARQPEHHCTRSFQDELRALLERHGVEYDERYVWD
jgi:putative transposase